jgi:hypothetical protein
MPAWVRLELVIPPELGDAEDVRRMLRERVAAAEALHNDRRRQEGRRVLGRRGVLQQSWQSAPDSDAPRRGLRPRVAARSVWTRIEALRRDRQFLRAYREARARWLAGDPIPFPIGTYWLRRFANVPIVDAQQN